MDLMGFEILNEAVVFSIGGFVFFMLAIYIYKSTRNKLNKWQTIILKIMILLSLIWTIFYGALQENSLRVAVAGESNNLLEKKNSSDFIVVDNKEEVKGATDEAEALEAVEDNSSFLVSFWALIVIGFLSIFGLLIGLFKKRKDDEQENNNAKFGRNSKSG